MISYAKVILFYYIYSISYFFIQLIECGDHCYACDDVDTCTQCVDTSLGIIDGGLCKCPSYYYMDLSDSICKSNII